MHERKKQFSRPTFMRHGNFISSLWDTQNSLTKNPRRRKVSVSRMVIFHICEICTIVLSLKDLIRAHSLWKLWVSLAVFPASVKWLNGDSANMCWVCQISTAVTDPNSSLFSPHNWPWIDFYECDMNLDFGLCLRLPFRYSDVIARSDLNNAMNKLIRSA